MFNIKPKPKTVDLPQRQKNQIIKSLEKVVDISLLIYGSRKRDLQSKINEFMTEYKKFIIMENESSHNVSAYDAKVADKFIKAQKEFTRFIEKY